jgi:prepilin-type N-terminal cleavage/methylation domain-containing protein
MKKFRNAARRGLTLIELVVVIAILAALAGLVIPRLDFLKNQADASASAATTADLFTQLQVHRSATNEYPAMDTLIDETGAAYSKLYSQGGAPLTVWTVDGPQSGASWYRSLLQAGLKIGVTMSSTASNASNAGSGNLVDLINESAAGTLKLATVNTSITSPSSYIPTLLSTLYPGGVTMVPGNSGSDGISGNSDDVATTYTQTAAGQVPSSQKLVAFGIGPKNTMTGKTMAGTPLQSDTDDPASVYCRYIAVFAVFNDGRPAQLKAVVDHRFKMVDKNLEAYRQAGAQ